MGNNIDKIKSGATTAFIDSTNKSSAAYKPEFISNDHTKSYDEFIDEYRIRYETIKMQIGFINNLKTLVEQGENKALLISATG